MWLIQYCFPFTGEKLDFKARSCNILKSHWLCILKIRLSILDWYMGRSAIPRNIPIITSNLVFAHLCKLKWQKPDF
jgi:hypothetical protein